MQNSEIVSTKVIIDCLDHSDSILVEKIRGYMDNGVRVHVLSITKSINWKPSKYTFIGKMSEQEGAGIILSSYTNKNRDCLIQIE